MFTILQLIQKQNTEQLNISWLTETVKSFACLIKISWKVMDSSVCQMISLYTDLTK